MNKTKRDLLAKPKELHELPYEKERIFLIFLL